MKISFIWDWPSYDPQTFTWQDGLAAAIKILTEKHDVQILTCSMNGKDYTLYHPYFPIQVSTDIKRDVALFKPDVILCWGDCTRPNAHPLSELNIPMALCFAGGQVDGPTYGYFDHFFVESQSYKDRFEVLGKSVSTAFGTNTDLFKPIPEQHKLFDVCNFSTYAGWKRHHLYAEATKGLTSVTAGYIIAQEDPIIGWVQKTGSLALPHTDAQVLRHLYAASKSCCLTSFSTGGSQRSVLEAMAMNIPLVVMKDSDKTSEYVYEGGEGLVVDPEPEKIRQAILQLRDTEVNTREFILNKWSEYKYAQALEDGLCKLVS
jgi:glycosyltransferase involved in cell wall biosynthesis